MVKGDIIDNSNYGDKYGSDDDDVDGDDGDDDDDDDDDVHLWNRRRGCSPPLSPSGLSQRQWLFLQFLCGFELSFSFYKKTNHFRPFVQF